MSVPSAALGANMYLRATVPDASVGIKRLGWQGWRVVTENGQMGC